MNEINNGGPRHLDKLFGQIKGMARDVRRSVRRHRVKKHSAVSLPRQICKICDLPFDMADSISAVVPQLSTCSKCKASMVGGYSAVRSPKHHFFVKSPALKAGDVFRVSEEEFFKIKETFKDKIKEADDTARTT